MTHSEIVIDYQYGGLNPMQFGYERCEPSHSFGPAVRTYWLLHYVVSGTGFFEREGVRHRVDPGQIFVIPPYQETFYQADGKRPWHYIWVGFTTKESLPELLMQPVVTSPDAGAVFQEMMECSHMESGRSAFLASCLWRLMAMLLEREKPKEGYVEKALNCMHSEYSRGITIQEIADRLGLDRSYFSALFARQMGTSPSEYLISLRLQKAAALMTAYGEKPAMAARSVGYEDLYHFSKIFKKHYGVAPREYRKRNEGQDLIAGSTSDMEAIPAEERKQKRKTEGRTMEQMENRLPKVRAFLQEKGWHYTFIEEDGLGSIDFEYRGVPYHIWEFEEDGLGVETNVRHGGRQEELRDDYEAELLEIMKDW